MPIRRACSGDASATSTSPHYNLHSIGLLAWSLEGRLLAYFLCKLPAADKLLLAVDCLVFYPFLRNAFSDILLVCFPVSNAFDVYIVCRGNTAQFQHSSPLPRRYPCYRTALALLSYRVSDVRTLH